jgi:hypothetical protein
MVKTHSILHKTIKGGQNTCQIMEDGTIKRSWKKKSKMKNQGERTENFCPQSV